MPVSFAVDLEAITEASSDVSQLVETHRRVLLEWRDLGQLIHPGDRLTDSPLLDAIDNLPGSAKKLWTVALKYNKRKPCAQPWDGSFEEEVIRRLRLEWKLSLLQSARATLIGNLEDDEASKCIPELDGMEVCRFHGIAQAKNLTESRNALTNAIEAGGIPRDEWMRRYGTWIRACDSAVLVDRYGLKDYLNCERAGKTSGLWLALRSFHAREKNTPVNINVFVGDQDVSYNDLEDFSERVTSQLANGGIRRLNIVAAPDSAFRDHCHHRYMRCDYAVFGFDQGFSAFSGEKIAKDCVIWKKDRAQDQIFDRSETNLSQAGFYRKEIL